jgi:hypothetical protein
MKSGGIWANGFFRATAAAEMGVLRNELNDETATSGDSGERGWESSWRVGFGTETQVSDVLERSWMKTHVQAWLLAPDHSFQASIPLVFHSAFFRTLGSWDW